jgi:hypothetical protein
VVSTMKKAADADMKQAVSTATREYDKKWKCVELEKVEREKAMIILFVGCLVNWIHPCFLVVNGISSFGVKYLETDEAESRNHTESDIPVSRPRWSVLVMGPSCDQEIRY